VVVLGGLDDLSHDVIFEGLELGSKPIVEKAIEFAKGSSEFGVIVVLDCIIGPR
jgi:hypothetical protein